MDPIEQNIKDGKYANHEPLPGKGASKEERRAIYAAYEKRNGEARNAFYEDALAELDLTEHPKAKILCEIAWDEGHAYGFHEVWSYMRKLAPLLSNQEDA